MSRWRRAWAQRARLVALARRRTHDDATAQDIADESIARVAVAYPDADADQQSRLLTTVVINLCNDHHRTRQRTTPAGIGGDLDSVVPVQLSHEDELCRHAEAQWAVGQLRHLRARDRWLLDLVAAGGTITDVAHVLGTTGAGARAAVSRARGRALALLPREVRHEFARVRADSQVTQVEARHPDNPALTSSVWPDQL